jgi:hypothetical protein
VVGVDEDVSWKVGVRFVGWEREMYDLGTCS